MTAPLLLLDSASLYFRAYFGLPDSLRSPDGRPVNAVRGMLDFLSTLVDAAGAAEVVACWDDDWRPQWRVALVPGYKAHRVAGDEVAATPDAGAAEEVPDELAPQVPIIAEVLTALGVPIVGAPEAEADDVIGTLAERAAGPVDIATGDRDLFQLVSDERHARVRYTARSVRQHQVVDDGWLLAKYGITGAQYADFATLRGDASDGLPGVAGVGEKTAAALVRTFGDLSGILAAAETGSPDIRPKVRLSLVDSADYLRRAAQVVRVRRDLAIRVPGVQPDPVAAAELGEQHGLGQSLGRASAALERMRER